VKSAARSSTGRWAGSPGGADGLDERFGEGREDIAAPVPDEQRVAEVLAQAGERRTHRGLAETQSLGGTSHVHFDVGPHRIMASVTTGALPRVGDSVAARVPSERVHLFAADGRALP